MNKGHFLLLLTLLGLNSIGAQEYDVDDAEEELRQLEERIESRPCGPCIKEDCVSPSNCLAGVVSDKCGCCQVCARTEGQLCDEFPHLPSARYGLCGENLQCSRSRDDVLESVCVCSVADKMVCGSDHVTYPTVCALNEEAMRRGEPDKFNPRLVMEYWGPCKESPVIISPPSDSYGPLGANLTLDCEARGFPAPEITWKLVSAKGETISLPSDDQQVAIQMRGGPEPLMVTGWMQIMALDPSYIGVYHCIATNTEGQVYAMASVGVYNNEL